MHVAFVFGNIFYDFCSFFLNKNSDYRGPFISAIDRCYCVDHFTCSSCAINLMDCGFVEENGKLYCESDFEQYFAPFCAKCGHKILKVKASILNSMNFINIIK